MSPEQQKLFDLIQNLPTHDSRLPMSELINGKFDEAEKAVQAYAQQLAASGQLNSVLNEAVQLPGGSVPLREYIQDVKRYQIESDGTLLSKSLARQGSIPGIPGHKEQREQFLAHSDASKQDAAVDTFLNELKRNTKAHALFAGNKVRIFDIGFHNGRVSATVAKSLQTLGIPPQNIAYEGMELLTSYIPEAKTAIENTGVKNVNLEGGMLGFAKDTLPDGKPNAAQGLVNTPAEQKKNIVLALNVSNLGDQKLFWKQVDGAMADNAIVIAQHEKNSALLNFKKSMGGLLRTSEPVPEKIAEHFKKEGREISSFIVPFIINFPAIDEGAWNVMKNVPTGVFNRPYEEDVKGTNLDPVEYKKFRLLVESVLAEPLGTFAAPDRAKVLDGLHELLDKDHNRLTSLVETQVIPSRNRSKDLGEAVQEATKEAGRLLAPQLNGQVQRATQPGGTPTQPLP